MTDGWLPSFLTEHKLERFLLLTYLHQAAHTILSPITGGH